MSAKWVYPPLAVAYIPSCTRRRNKIDGRRRRADTGSKRWERREFTIRGEEERDRKMERKRYEDSLQPIKPTTTHIKSYVSTECDGPHIICLAGEVAMGEWKGRRVLREDKHPSRRPYHWRQWDCWLAD
jgi:hypothetical protein